MRRELSEMTDEELLAFTRSMDAAPDMREVVCMDCGEVFEVDNREWNVKRCPACQKAFTRDHWGKNPSWDIRRHGDGLKKGSLTRR